VTITPPVVRYVADSSIIAQAVVADSNSPRVDTLLAGLILRPPAAELWTPDLYQVECANVIWKRVKFLGLAEQDGRDLLARLIQLPLVVVQFGPFLARGLEIGMAQNLAIYDSLYIALAEKLNCELITEDAKQAVAAQAAGVRLKSIDDFQPFSTAPWPRLSMEFDCTTRMVGNHES
jgi:predicted nucleic acid-binding protein